MDSYIELNNEFNRLRKELKDLYLTNGDKSNEYISKKEKIQDLDAKIKEIDSNLGISTRHIKKYNNG